MTAINMFEAKTTLSKLVADIEAKVAPGFILARNGKPVAKLVACSPTEGTQRLGVAEGAFVVPDDIDADNVTVAALFLGGSR